MELTDTRCLIAGATGEVGRRFSHRLKEAGAKVALAGRNEDRLKSLGEELDAPTAAFDASDLESCKRAVNSAADELGGLDVLIVSTGTVTFGPAAEMELDPVLEMFHVNVFGPMALIRAALERIESGSGAILGMSAIVADYPTADMAAYSASKAALSAYLAAVRRERRRDGLTVLDVRPQHMETGFSDRAISGDPPPLPDPIDVDHLVDLAIDALKQGKREIAYDVKSRELLVN